MKVTYRVQRAGFYLLMGWLLLLPLSTFAASTSVGKLVVLGDSLSAGYGIDVNKGWVALFAKKLKQQGIPLTVHNESISGEVTAGGLARLPKILHSQPTWLFIELGGNDGLRGMSPKAMRRNLYKMITLAQSKGTKVMLLGMKLPPNYGVAYTKLFENVYKRVAKDTGVPLLPFLLEGVGTQRKLMQGDGIHPTAGAQQRIMRNVWEFAAPFLKS